MGVRAGWSTVALAAAALLLGPVSLAACTEGSEGAGGTEPGAPTTTRPDGDGSWRSAGGLGIDDAGTAWELAHGRPGPLVVTARDRSGWEASVELPQGAPHDRTYPTAIVDGTDLLVARVICDEPDCPGEQVLHVDRLRRDGRRLATVGPPVRSRPFTGDVVRPVAIGRTGDETAIVTQGVVLLVDRAGGSRQVDLPADPDLGRPCFVDGRLVAVQTVADDRYALAEVDEHGATPLARSAVPVDGPYGPDPRCGPDRIELAPDQRLARWTWTFDDGWEANVPTDPVAAGSYAAGSQDGPWVDVFERRGDVGVRRRVDGATGADLLRAEVPVEDLADAVLGGTAARPEVVVCRRPAGSEAPPRCSFLRR